MKNKKISIYGPLEQREVISFKRNYTAFSDEIVKIKIVMSNSYDEYFENSIQCYVSKDIFKNSTLPIFSINYFVDKKANELRKTYMILRDKKPINPYTFLDIKKDHSSCDSERRLYSYCSSIDEILSLPIPSDGLKAWLLTNAITTPNKQDIIKLCNSF